MGWTAYSAELSRLARSIDPAVRLVTKDSWFWHAVAWVLYVVTFGAIKRQTFLEDYATTFGPVQAYPATWPVDEIFDVVVHESRHTRQARWFGLGIHPWVGLPFMGIGILLPFPIGIAWVRYRLELDADAAAWRYRLRSGKSRPEDIMADARRRARSVGGRDYFWSWPLTWALWGYERKAQKVIDAR